jgi:hypothetical protein
VTPAALGRFFDKPFARGQAATWARDVALSVRVLGKRASEALAEKLDPFHGLVAEYQAEVSRRERLAPDRNRRRSDLVLEEPVRRSCGSIPIAYVSSSRQGVRASPFL